MKVFGTMRTQIIHYSEAGLLSRKITIFVIHSVFLFHVVLFGSYSFYCHCIMYIYIVGNCYIFPSKFLPSEFVSLVIKLLYTFISFKLLSFSFLFDVLWEYLLLVAQLFFYNKTSRGTYVDIWIFSFST